MAWTSEDERLLAELAGEVAGTAAERSEPREVPRFGSKSSSSSGASRRSSLKSLDSVTSLLEKLDRPHGERSKAQRTSKEVEALPEVSGLKEGLRTEASLRSRQAEQHHATREQVLPATKSDQDKEEEAQRELAAERASSEKAQQELSRLREELQTEASLRSRQAEQHHATREQEQQQVSCLQEELQTAETSLHRHQAELLAASAREQVLLASPKSEDSKEEVPKSLWARFRRQDLSPARVSRDSQKAQQELSRLKETLRTVEAQLQEASKRDQAQQELNRLTVELQTAEASLYTAALKREQDAQRELSGERVAFQEAQQELSRLREQLRIAEEKLQSQAATTETARKDEDVRDLDREAFQQAQQELFRLGAELQFAEAGLWHQRAELEEEMQTMQLYRPAKQLQTSPSNKQKLHGQQQLHLLQEEVRKQEEEAKSQEAQRSFWQQKSEEQEREIEKFRSELRSLQAETHKAHNAGGCAGMEEQQDEVTIQSSDPRWQLEKEDGDMTPTPCGETQRRSPSPPEAAEPRNVDSADPEDGLTHPLVGADQVDLQITIQELRGELEAQEKRIEEEATEKQALQQQIQGISAAEAHQELRMHSRLAHFEMHQLQEMQEVKHHLHEELAERERQHRVDSARHAELSKDSKSREESLGSTLAELEKELKFWQRRSDEDLEELLQLQSEMKSLKDSEALAAADWEKTLHMNLRQQQMEAHEDLRQVRDELQRAIEALQGEQEKSEQKQKAGERELLALRTSFQQELTRAESELQVTLVQERGRFDALRLTLEADCAQRLEVSGRREKYLEEELRGRNELCTEAADALRENLMELEKQVELNEERREGEAQLASRVEQLEKQRREWKKTTKALENQEQEMVALRKDLRLAAEQHQTSPVNKRRLRVQLEELQEQFQKELAEQGEEHERELEAAKEAEEKLQEEMHRLKQLQEQLEEQHAELLDPVQRAEMRPAAWQRCEAQQQELLELQNELESLKDTQAGATFISVNADQAQEAIEMLTQELRRARAAQQDFGEEVLAARALVQEELQCYNSSRIEQQAKFEAELAEKDKQHQKHCEELKELHKIELEATKEEEKLRPESEEMTRLRDELRHLEEQRLAENELCQEDEEKNQRLAAEVQQQLSEWQQRSERQRVELEAYLREIESCRRSEEQFESSEAECQRRIEDLERREEVNSVKVEEVQQAEQAELAVLRSEVAEQSEELVELQSEMQCFKAAKEAVTACCEQLIQESQQELEERSRVARRAREDWRNQRCRLLGQLRQSFEEKHLLEEKLCSRERDLWEASEHLKNLWEHGLQLQEECQMQNLMLKGGLRQTLEEQQEEALALHHAVQAKERELLEMKIHRQEWSGEEEQLQVQLQQSEMRCKMQGEEVQEVQELQQELLMERRKCLEKVAQAEAGQEEALQAERGAIRAEERCQVQESLHQAELARLTARYEKALLRCSSEQARLLSRYEREKEEWAADWKEVNDIMQPLIQSQEAAEAQRVSRQAAAQEGLKLLNQFAQLKEQTQELKRGRQASEAGGPDESRAASGAEAGVARAASR